MRSSKGFLNSSCVLHATLSILNPQASRLETGFSSLESLVLSRQSRVASLGAAESVELKRGRHCDTFVMSSHRRRAQIMEKSSRLPLMSTSCKSPRLALSEHLRLPRSRLETRDSIPKPQDPSLGDKSSKISDKRREQIISPC